MKSCFCQDAYGQITPVYSISARLDYPGVGPEHAWLYDTGRASYVAITDDETADAFERVSRLEGIIPAIESAHGPAYATKLAPTLPAELACALDRAGADTIELGIPLSDPIAEGPVIQGASARALEGGATTDRVLDLMAGRRGSVSASLVFMTSGNIVFHYGTERFCARAEQVGIDGSSWTMRPLRGRESSQPPVPRTSCIPPQPRAGRQR